MDRLTEFDTKVTLLLNKRRSTNDVIIRSRQPKLAVSAAPISKSIENTESLAKAEMDGESKN